jgi:hypothetical protein
VTVRPPRARLAGIAAAAAAIAFASPTGAHKPITSPFTFNADVLPIVMERCAACHQRGGVAPMSLLTHADAVPWGESMRAELMAGHMPPWRVDSSAERFRNVRPMTGRELNVLLTWASGGTPAGDPVNPANAISRAEPSARWPLGPPDVVLPMPEETILAAQQQEVVSEFVIEPGIGTRRFVRAVDLQPGTPAIVRSASVSVRPPSDDGRDARGARRDGGDTPERLIGLWLPGDHPVMADAGSGFDLPPGSDLVVRIRYRKTWEYENRAMSDQSTLGIYFADGPAADIRKIDLAVDLTGGKAVRSATLAQPMRAIAVYPDAGSVEARLALTAIRPDGSRERLIEFRPRRGWARRYWFREPIVLPRGARIELEARADDALLPPGTIQPAAPPDSAKVGLTLNVVPEQ